jgi:hypothetical protein
MLVSKFLDLLNKKQNTLKQLVRYNQLSELERALEELLGLEAALVLV